ncbi:MAG: hypothetical protein ACLPKI_04225 [Streptosporangiaceae bacterium]
MYRQAGTIVTEHTFTVPLDHGQPDGAQIEVFAREVTAASPAAPGRSPEGAALAAVPAGRPRVRRAAPLGPGVLAGPGAGRLPGAAAGSARYGRSTPAGRHTLTRLPTPQAQAGYLARGAA